MSGKNKKTHPVASRWIRTLKDKGYNHCQSRISCGDLKKFPRVWRKIFSNIKVNPHKRGQSVFEVGCGGGKHLAFFAMNGWRCTGLDCSKNVLERADNYFSKISKKCNKELNVDLICNDFLNYDLSAKNKFDIVFNVGVIEHFLNREDRLLFLKKKFQLVKKGGYLISIVPNGIHPLREKMKKNRLGGYNIPEIDYTPELVRQELQKFNPSMVEVLPHNLFRYFLLNKRDTCLLYCIKKFLYLALQILPASILPSKFAFQQAGTLIGIAQK